MSEQKAPPLEMPHIQFPPTPGYGYEIDDVFTMDVFSRRPWWAFWRRPSAVRREYRITAHLTARQEALK